MRNLWLASFVLASIFLPWGLAEVSSVIWRGKV